MIDDIIYSVIEVVNKDLPPEMRLSPEWETPLLGDNSKIDSMGIVSLLAELESQFSEKLGLVPDIWVEWNGIDGSHPLRSLGTLRSYLKVNLQTLKGDSN